MRAVLAIDIWQTRSPTNWPTRTTDELEEHVISPIWRYVMRPGLLTPRRRVRQWAPQIRPRSDCSVVSRQLARQAPLPSQALNSGAIIARLGLEPGVVVSIDHLIDGDLGG